MHVCQFADNLFNSSWDISLNSTQGILMEAVKKKSENPQSHWDTFTGIHVSKICLSVLQMLRYFTSVKKASWGKRESPKVVSSDPPWHHGYLKHIY